MAENRCWSCGLICQSLQDLQNHLHESPTSNDIKLLLDDDKYLKPFMEEDALLYSFGEDEEGEEDYPTSTDKEEQIRMMGNFDAICIDDENVLASDVNTGTKNVSEVASASNDCVNLENPSDKVIVNGNDARECIGLSDRRPKNKQLRVSFANVAAKEIKNVNENYFGAYSSFGIHREMISDKVHFYFLNLQQNLGCVN